MLYSDTIIQWVLRTGMLADEDRVICGVSGGADSVFLFYFLKELRELLNLELHVVHVHHGIRGQEADRDAEYVKSMCEQAGIPFSLYYRRIPEEAAARGLTLEEAGRNARREVFREAAAGLADRSLQHLDISSEQLHISSQQLDTSSQQSDMLPQQPDMSSQHLDMPSQQLDMPPQQPDMSSQHLEMLPQQPEMIPQRRTVKIAVAHHKNDLAESVLFRIARGTGVQGLAAMRPVSVLEAGNGVLPRMELIRPLLGLSRQEIEAALRREGINWCEDSTNAEDDAARNRIRHNILPAMEADINRAAVNHIAALAEQAGEVTDFLLEEIRLRYPKYVGDVEERLPDGSRAAGLSVSSGLIQYELPAMQSGIVHRALAEISFGAKDLGRIHVEDTLRLFHLENGKALHLPAGVRALRTTEGIFLYRTSQPLYAQAVPGHENTPEYGREPVRLLPGEAVKWENMRISADLQAFLPGVISEKRYTKTIDYGKITDTLVIRTRKPGDFLTVRSDGARKKLSDYFTDEKVPRDRRDRIPLLADGHEIVWVIGMRLGYRYRVSESTERFLTVSAELCGEDK